MKPLTHQFPACILVRIIWAIAVLWTPIVGSAANKDTRPNIVLIMCDDLGYSDVGFNGADDIRTPHLDSLANSGTVFTSAYVPHPFCGPSRMGIMTGRYPHTIGAPFNLPNPGLLDDYVEEGVATNEPLMSEMLSDAGYLTGAIGKWHMGTTRSFHPNNRGFSEYFGFLGGGHKYFPENYQSMYDRQVRAGKKNINEYIRPLERNNSPVDESEYLTDALSREAVEFVSKSSMHDQPFFLYLAYNAPHTPLEAKEDDLRLFESIQSKDRRVYAAMVYAVDRGVGRLVDALKKTQSLENTMIVFLSDNGGQLRSGATNRPLRDGKGSTFEGGFRVPMFVHWPREIAGKTTCDYPVSALDFYPTFAKVGNCTIPAQKKLDGIDISNVLATGKSANPARMIFAMRHRASYSDVAVREGKWKAVRHATQWRLFNVAEDIGEQADLGDRHPEILRRMVGAARDWSQGHTAPKWFHAAKARDDWQSNGMPNHQKTFRVKGS